MIILDKTTLFTCCAQCCRVLAYTNNNYTHDVMTRRQLGFTENFIIMVNSPLLLNVKSDNFNYSLCIYMYI